MHLPLLRPKQEACEDHFESELQTALNHAHGSRVSDPGDVRLLNMRRGSLLKTFGRQAAAAVLF